MEPKDIQLLNEMKRIIIDFRSDGSNLCWLADNLLVFRDNLQFKDPKWYYELTKHIVSLDSACSYVPKNDEQAMQVNAAIATAINNLLRLIEEKLS